MAEPQDPTEPTPRPARKGGRAAAPGASQDPRAADPQEPVADGQGEAPTAELPATDAAAPAASAAAAPGSPPGGPAGPPPRGPGGPPPGGPAGAATGGGYPQGPPPRRPGLWRQATSTTGGTVAVAVAAAALALLLLGVVGLGGLFVARAVASDSRDDRLEQVRDRGVLGDRDGREGRVPPGMRDRRDGGGQGRELPRERDGAVPDSRGDGLGQLMRGALALGAVQHGEFTVTGADGKAVVMTVQRGTVTAVSGTSLAVRSTDGFSATYKLDDATRGGADLAKDDSALVVARKDGATAVVVRELRTR